MGASYRRALALLAFAIAGLACGGSGDLIHIGEGETRTGDSRGTRTITISPDEADQEGSEGSGEVGASECDDSLLEPSSDNLARVAAATLCLVNVERRERDRGELSDNRLLAGAAQRKAEDMARRDYFAHVGPDGKNVEDWVRGTGYLPESGGYTLGENIGWAGKGAATAHGMVEQWMGSPTHRRNILAPDFTDSGIGVVAAVPDSDAEAGATYAHFFGSPTPPG